MRDFTFRKWLLAVLLLLLPWVVNAAGLGRLNVLSSLGQPFHAEIDLASMQKEELASLSVRLASPEAYRQADLQYNAVVAGLMLSIDRRSSGQPYIKVTSTRPVNEFVVDLLVELNWSSGRLIREYRALLDPPGVEPAPAPRAVAPPPPPRAVAPERPAAVPGTYGPIQRGETLSKIARSLRPEGISVEQMLVGLFRSNQDAFISKNMNLVKSGKILRVPEKEELATIPQQEAVKEYRAQVADWNAYHRKLADTASVAPHERTTAKGRITAKVEDKVPAETKDVVRLSKGEAPEAATGAGQAGKQRGASERIRVLEEEIVARDKALSEANERVAQLEKTIKEMQRLIEIKSASMAAAQQQAAKETAPKPEAAKPAPKPAETPATQAKPAPPKPVQKAPPPPPEPSLLDTLSDPLYLGVGGGAIIVLAGLGYWLMRRRRAGEAVDEPVKTAPTLNKAAAAAVPGLVVAEKAAADTAPSVVAPAAAVAAADELDPLDEARVYLAHGRDMQAETILQEALAKEPSRQAVHLKLLEIHAARKDKAAFGKHAQDFNRLTGGQGENWLKVAAMGFALDPENPLYVAGKGAASAASAVEAPAVDLDLELDLSPPGTATTDIPLDVDVGKSAGPAEEPVAAQPAASMMPDFDLEVPAEPQTDRVREVRPAAPAALDFDLELPKIEIPETSAASAASQPEPKQSVEPDFKLDLAEIDLNLDDQTQSATVAAAGKDPHWYDVQTKFDLAKAYQEMGDKAGAKEILQEVVKEGDTEQQAQAKFLLAAL